MTNPTLSRSFKFCTLLVAFLTCLLTLAPVNLRAQEGLIDTVGKVTAKNSSSITIATEDKKNPTLVFAIDQKTTIARGRTTITIDAIETGEMARVVAEKKDGQQLATMITVRPKP